MWKISDVDSHKKGLTKKQKEQWIAIANSVLKKCIDKGGSEETCAPSAIKQANGAVESYSVYKSKQESYTVQEKIHQDRKHLIVPVVMMVEGVHEGSGGALLHLIEDLGKFPESWNGIPVVINHPKTNDQFCSANSPDIIDNECTGRVYDTHVAGSKLKANIWLDDEKLQKKSPDAYQSIIDNNELEVSVGVFTENEDTQGEYNGENYDAIARNHRPDHLAILPGGTGACSLDDGCGIRVNEKGGKNVLNNETVTGMEQKRKELGMTVAEFYAVPRDPPSDSKLPIFDEAHVRNAMARFSQTEGMSADEKAKAKRKIISKAKKFDIDTSGFEDVNANELFCVMQSLNANGFSVSEIGVYSDIGFNELMDILRQKLNGMDTSDKYHYIEEVYPSYLIYTERSKNANKLLKQSYDKDFNFIGNTVEVKRKVTYESIINNSKNKEDKNMPNASNCPKCLEKVNALIANEKSNWKEGDREWLLTQEESVLDRLVPVEIEKTVEVNKLTPDQQADLALVAKMRQEKRNTLIQGIQANTNKELWPDTELNTLSDDKLERIFKSVKKEEVDYSLNSGFNSNSACDEEPMI